MTDSNAFTDRSAIANDPVKQGFTAVVVAHPDDEALWLSSAIVGADRVIFCYGDLFERPRDSSARRAAVTALPLGRVLSLDVPESGVKTVVEWARPRLTESGIAIADPAARIRYEANYSRLESVLRQVLAGAATVYTHNPWGEYGHAEHIQVHRAVASLQPELGYALWFSNYVSRKSWPLACNLSAQVSWTNRCCVAPDRNTARRLMRFYRRHGAWTWNATHRWPKRETLYEIHPPGSPHPQFSMEGEWVLDVEKLCWWPPVLGPRHRRLRADV
ncbi:MAG: PIG-L family deacetylase [Gammaproteobacteria bacterium]|nr:PIG-L family deacetylase [Gammaproteobacteria bacterium]